MYVKFHENWTIIWISGINGLKQDLRRIHALPRTYVYLDITAIVESWHISLGSPKEEEV